MNLDQGRQHRGLFLARLALMVYWIALTLGTHWPRLDITAPIGLQNNFLPGGVDKWVHVLAFAGLCWLSMAARLLSGRVYWVTIFLIAYASLDETAQLFVPGRGVYFADFVASSSGVLLGAITWITGKKLGFWAIDPTNAPTPGSISFVLHARLVTSLTLLSRVFGLVRDRVMAVAFGFSEAMDVWVIAFMIPNLFRRLFGEGALSAAFIPYYTKLVKTDPRRAGRFASFVLLGLTFTLLAVTSLTIISMSIALDADIVSDKWITPLQLTQLTLWYAPMVCVVALLGGMLQVHHRFGPLAAAPIILNIFIIGASLYYWLAKGDEWTHMQGLRAVGIAVLFAGAVQIIWQLIELWRERGEWFSLRAPRVHGAVSRDSSVREELLGLLRQWGPAALGLAVLQINVLLDVLIAKFFSGPAGETFNFFGRTLEWPMQNGPAVLGFTARLYELPLGVFGIAVATSIFPALAAAATDSREKFADLLRQGIRLTLFIGLPASLGLVLVRYPLARAIYSEAGELTADAAPRIAWVLLGYAPAVWAYSMNQVLTRAFFAHHNTTTPMRVSLAMVTLNLTLNLILLWPLGAAGLAWSTAICAMLQTAILLKLVTRYVDNPLNASVRQGAFRTLFLTAIMAVMVGGGLQYFDPQSMPYLHVIGLLAGATALGGAVVFIGARLLKMPELSWILRRQS